MAIVYVNTAWAKVTASSRKQSCGSFGSGLIKAWVSSVPGPNKTTDGLLSLVGVKSLSPSEKGLCKHSSTSAEVFR